MSPCPGSARLLGAAATVSGAANAAEGDRVMTPIGGGYETPTLGGFARAAAVLDVFGPGEELAP